MILWGVLGDSRWALLDLAASLVRLRSSRSDGYILQFPWLVLFETTNYTISFFLQQMSYYDRFSFSWACTLGVSFLCWSGRRGGML